MQYTQHFIIEGRYLGSTPRGKVNAHGSLTAPAPFAFFCPRCGDLWARCPVEGHTPFEPVWTWAAWSISCRKCRPNFGEVPGSLIFPWACEFNEDLPLEVMQRELTIHLDWWERKHT